MSKRASSRILLAALLGLVTLAAPKAQETVYYDYDVRGRLVATCFVEAGTLIAYSYDAAGNRSSVVTENTACGTSNQPPQAFNDSVSGDFSTFDTVVVDAIANDTDPDDDSLTITDAVCVTGGCLVFISDNKLSITGTTAGTKSVTYTISDGRGGTDSASATVSTFEGEDCCQF